MVLGKLPVPGRSTNSDNSRARACCVCSRCGWFRLSFLASFSLPQGDGPTTNRPTTKGLYLPFILAGFHGSVWLETATQFMFRR